MASKICEIESKIKYFCILEKNNSPLISLNFVGEESELELQTLVYSSLDILAFREKEKYAKKVGDINTGLLFQFFQGDTDLATYGFLGNNGFKAVVVIELTEEPNNQELLVELNRMFIETQLHYKKLLLNTFFRWEMFFRENELREKFLTRIVEIVKLIKI